MKIDNPKNRTLTLERTLNAPISLVWEAWTQPEHIAQWWGPKGMQTKILEHDFREGGQWKYAMTMPDGNEFIADGVYKTIVKHECIISSANFKPMTEGVEIQALFKSEGDTTHMTFNCVHDTEEYCKQQEQMGFYNGWGSVFDRLAEFVAS
nr:SRPBCC domain-containing protein [Allomuricauda sp.]